MQVGSILADPIDQGGQVNELECVGKDLISSLVSLVDNLTPENAAESLRRLLPLVERVFNLLYFKIPSCIRDLNSKTDHVSNSALALWGCLSKQTGLAGTAASSLSQRQYALLMMALSALWIRIADKRAFIQGLSEYPSEAHYSHHNAAAAEKRLSTLEGGGVGVVAFSTCVKSLALEFPRMAPYFTLVEILESDEERDVVKRTQKVQECWEQLFQADSALSMSTIGMELQQHTEEEEVGTGAATTAPFNFTTLPKAELSRAPLRARLLDFSTLHLSVSRSIILFSCNAANTAILGLLTSYCTSSKWAVETTVHVAPSQPNQSADGTLAVKDIFCPLVEALSWQWQLRGVADNIKFLPGPTTLILPQPVVDILQNPDLDPVFSALSSAASHQRTDNLPKAESAEDAGGAVFDAIVVEREACDGSAEDSTTTSTTLAASALDEVRSIVTERIPRECDFSGTSAACRDSDQLTRLLRRVMFLPTTTNSAAANGIPVGLMQKIIFQRDGLSRKRPRSSDPPAEAIPLLPVSSDLSSMFDTDAAGEAKTVLEKICSESCWSN